MADVRLTLDRVIRERGEDYAALSRLIGRNPAYIQQFIRRGSPRRLAEADRQTLARYLAIDEKLLGALEPLGAPPAPAALMAVPRLAVEASAGPGALSDQEEAVAKFGFDARWLRSLTATPQLVSAISVRGESMHPTLGEGDDILVDRGDAAERLRDGVYVVRMDDALLVKRVVLNPTNRRISIRSDNPAYPSWEDCDPSNIVVIGRVIWAGRRFL
ncbi:MAG: hypothetical protein RLZZ561_1447 [Pseudomonadota bacterium]|jgi:phage repressor protein C with HTH and peptisase S24 domain